MTRVYRLTESGKVLQVESGIQLEESEPLESRIQESGISSWSPESISWNPEYKMVFYSLTWREVHLKCAYHGYLYAKA